MQLLKDYRYALVLPTSIGVRITPDSREPVHTSRHYTMQTTSAESNVGQISASLGLPVKLLTAFVKGSPVSAFIKSELRARNFDFEGPDLDQGGPWGLRHQFNIADSGFGLRGPRVWNDRAGEVGRQLKAQDFDLERIFGEEKAAIVHLSGLIAAISSETTQFCLAIARQAKANGSRLSFDLNYRASFWAGREAELRESFLEIASLADILIGNEEDYQLALGLEGPEPGGEDLLLKTDAFKKMVLQAQARFPQSKVFATTLREVISANEHAWGALLYTDGQWYLEAPRKIQILDRIGGGDGFVGGLLYSLLQGFAAEDCLKFAWASGALATTTMNDYAQPTDEKQVWDLYAGNARVQR